jgi:hypothetical protein
MLRKDYFCFSSQRTCGTSTEFEIKENGRQIECGPRSTIYNSENNSSPTMNKFVTAICVITEAAFTLTFIFTTYIYRPISQVNYYLGHSFFCILSP